MSSDSKYKPSFLVDKFSELVQQCVRWIKLKQSSLVILMSIIQQKKKKNSYPYTDNFKSTRVKETSKSIIDLILVDSKRRIVQCDVLNSSISDHNAIFCAMKGGSKKLPLKVFEYRSFKSFEEKAFINDLEQVPWSVIEGVGALTILCFFGRSSLKIMQITTHLLNQGALKECQLLGFLINFWK